MKKIEFCVIPKNGLRNVLGGGALLTDWFKNISINELEEVAEKHDIRITLAEDQDGRDSLIVRGKDNDDIIQRMIKFNIDVLNREYNNKKVFYPDNKRNDAEKLLYDAFGWRGRNGRTCRY